MKSRFLAIGLLVVGLLAGYFVYPKWGIWEGIRVPFRLGLDLKGGIHLIYKADLSKIPEGEHTDALEGLRDVIERRVNFFGVSEPIVRIERVLGEDRLSVQLAGIADAKEAIRLIGETPYLEFRRQKQQPPAQGSSTPAELNVLDAFEPTDLTGRYLTHAGIQFDSTTNNPYIEIQFNDEGGKLFEQLTGENLGKPIAIFLDGAPISIPVVQSKISGGQAQITGQFTPDEARLLAQRLNSGALPVPIELISQQSVEATRGKDSLERSFFAGMIGFLFVIAFMILWYRVPGVLAVFALAIYVVLSLTVFKLVPVTFSTAAIAGFVLSIGMAVDANILIFERMREELSRGKNMTLAIEEGFRRAWTSVRDSNVSSLITALILWYFGTDAIKGFALTLGLGIGVSMFSAIVVTRTFLRATHPRRNPPGTLAKFLYSSGWRKTV
jgi:preprotein translocase subunit SecD